MAINVLVFVCISLLLWLISSTCYNIWETNLPMNYSTCKSLQQVDYSFHTLHAPRITTIIFNSFYLDLVCVYHHLLCQHFQNYFMFQEMNKVCGWCYQACILGKHTWNVGQVGVLKDKGFPKWLGWVTSVVLHEKKNCDWQDVKTYWNRRKNEWDVYTNECNQSQGDVCFIFPIIILDVCLIKFWHLYWKE